MGNYPNVTYCLFIEMWFFTCVTELLVIATCYMFIVDTVLFTEESLRFVLLVQVSPVLPESRPL